MLCRSCHELLLSCALSFRYAYLKAASFILSDSKSPASGTSPRSRRIRGTTPRGVAVAAAAAPAFVILSIQTHEPSQRVCVSTPKAPGVIASTTALFGGLVRFQHTQTPHQQQKSQRATSKLPVTSTGAPTAPTPKKKTRQSRLRGHRERTTSNLFRFFPSSGERRVRDRHTSTPPGHNHRL